MKGLLVITCALLLVSCARPPGFSTLPSGSDAAQSFRSGADAIKFTRLLSFRGSNGKEPSASLIDANGTLHGTTYAGGTHNEGTVFAIESGTVHVLHAFKGGSDGALPLASLTDVHGIFYGTTVNGGGPGGEGIVFKVTSAGTETVVHRFGAAGDGANPYGALLDLNGTLYGTTAGGGSASNGTVFTISSGKESVLYDFSSNHGDGATPAAGLLNVKGTLYGTTEYGGGHCASVGCGTVYKITPSGAENVLYAFKGGTDGSSPAAPLVHFNGALYGTTTRGGTANQGTVFKVTTSGSESVVYSFKGGTDGAVPQGLIASGRTLYGTTSGGGTNNLGTVFAMTAAGKKRLLYAFRGGTDGAVPRAGLLDVSGTFYGTTAKGGGSKAGTVFSITP